MKKNLVISVVLLMVLTLGMVQTAVAEDLNGEEIIDRVDETLNARTRDSKIKMTIVNSGGQKRLRTITIKSKGEKKGLVKFLSPADVEGTALLTITENNKDKMWLYLPALGNVRKISSSQKNGSFMGTDFTYKDIDMVGGSNYRDDYKTELVAEEQFAKKECYVLKSIPTDEEIEYSKMKMWVRKNNFMPLKLEFYDQEGKLKKIMTNSDITEIDQHLTPEKIVMKNVQENTETILELKDIKFDINLPDHIFTTRNLSH